jgi:hypothetical protein
MTYLSGFGLSSNSSSLALSVSRPGSDFFFITHVIFDGLYLVRRFSEDVSRGLYLLRVVMKYPV